MLSVEHTMDSSSSSSEDEDSEEIYESNLFIKHLRKCFIAVDDTSYCESGLLPDLKIFNKYTPEVYLDKELENKNFNENKLRSILSKRIDAESYEYVSFNKSKDLRRKPVTESIHQIEPSYPNLAEKNKNTLPIYNPDEKYEIELRPKEAPNFQNETAISKITQLLKEDNCEQSPFLIYKKFEAYTPHSNQVKNFTIFLPMCDIENNAATKKRKASMKICIIKTAKVSDLIGLICCNYIIQKLQPPLKSEDVNNYFLKITDDNGDVEEFPELPSNDQLDKFGFKDFALLDKSEIHGSMSSLNSVNKTLNEQKVPVTIHFTDGNYPRILEYENKNVSIKTIFDDIVKLKNNATNIFCPAISYRMELFDEPGVMVNFNENLSYYKKYEFYFFRENSERRIMSIPRKSITQATVSNDFTKLIIRNSEYIVNYLSKWSKVSFKIDNFELEERNSNILTGKSTNFYSIPIINVMNCVDIKSTKSNDEKNFCRIRIIVVEDDNMEQVSSVAYKYLDFECDLKTGEEVKNTIKHLINYCNSPYLSQFNESDISPTKWSRKLYKTKRKTR